MPNRAPPRSQRKHRVRQTQSRRSRIRCTAPTVSVVIVHGGRMPQPDLRLIDRSGDVAARLCGQTGDQHRVLLIGRDHCQVLGAPRRRGHRRLPTHERHRTSPGELAQHSPPVSGRLTRHREPDEPFAGARSAAQSNAGPISHALHRDVLRASTFESRSQITTICLRSTKSMATIALLPAPTIGAGPVSRCGCDYPRRAITVTHERPPCAWDTQPEAHQEDVPTSRPQPQNVSIPR